MSCLLLRRGKSDGLDKKAVLCGWCASAMRGMCELEEAEVRALKMEKE